MLLLELLESDRQMGVFLSSSHLDKRSSRDMASSLSCT